MIDKKLKRLLRVLAILSGTMWLALALAIAFGGPRQPKSLPSINNPFAQVDVSDMPPIERFIARDGAALAYRRYSAKGARGSVVLIHGSSARSNSVHPLARGLARAGYAVYALDVRGHGASGTHGQIAYVGQLEDDLEDFLGAVKPSGNKTLIGFSSGGGFALRFAADVRQKHFDQYLLLAPFLHQDAITARGNGAPWVSAGVPRIVGLEIVNRIGIAGLNSLPVLAFALNDEARKILTPQYSYALAKNFRPHSDYRHDIQSAHQPMAVLVGDADELFFPERFAPIFSDAGRPTPVTIVPNTGHIALTLSAVGIQAVQSAVERLTIAGTAVAAREYVRNGDAM